ncbi:MAG: hypothetical protein KME60_06770 [Cyanomargarita calcarea GSE-NOS-MK-12-04C]|jgi:glycosyltransferase involved in cell wall biosynthesis|uniref:Glycosyl transferase family 1 domain-containing protein n=1 Tax=Cyanomargarita calcarea GSE-NOS-MK-12-04C TaxID=2839659 RepID=A0A951QIL3_9CYAN|nr:hypothetical protein [Cyanomargarita calcarea GSE-NOS-MK-12-04C]
MFPPGDFARLQWTLQHAKVITAVSADMARKIQRLGGRDDVIVLKNAVDTEIFCPYSQGNLIASDAGGIPEVISHSENGFMIPRYQLHKLGEAVLECLGMTEDERRKIGKMGRDRIVREHSINQEKLLLQTVVNRLIPNSV